MTLLRNLLLEIIVDESHCSLLKWFSIRSVLLLERKKERWQMRNACYDRRLAKIFITIGLEILIRLSRIFRDRMKRRKKNNNTQRKYSLIFRQREGGGKMHSTLKMHITDQALPWLLNWWNYQIWYAWINFSNDNEED